MARKETTSSDESFEAGLGGLEKIVARLEQGNLPLEEALDAFETGVGLLRRLHAKLGDVEKRVEALVRDAEGVLRVREAKLPSSGVREMAASQPGGAAAAAADLEDEDPDGDIPF